MPFLPGLATDPDAVRMRPGSNVINDLATATVAAQPSVWINLIRSLLSSRGTSEGAVEESDAGGDVGSPLEGAGGGLGGGSGAFDDDGGDGDDDDDGPRKADATTATGAQAGAAKSGTKASLFAPDTNACVEPD